jgi:UDP-N-acetyl-D-mannosaminuronic acid transferase (WecB/TagA/CpsF family)
MSDEFCQILGVRFFTGGLPRLLDLTAGGGLVVVPSAPVLADMRFDEHHRQAVEGADFAITDSGFMVMLWLLLRRTRLTRISGLRYLRALLDDPRFRAAGATLWVMPSSAEARANRFWLQSRGIPLTGEDCYLAPLYPKGPLTDPALVAMIEARRPRYVVLNIGGGVQERLGYHLRNTLSYRPSILCTGAAIGFLSGNQANIPPWADRMFLGWFLRVLREPRRFLPRYRRALGLVPLLLRFQENSIGSKR